MKQTKYEDEWTEQDREEFVECVRKKSVKGFLKEMTDKGFCKGYNREGEFVLWRNVKISPAYVN